MKNEIVNVIGAEAAQALCAYFGGSSIYIPKQIIESNEIKARNESIIKQYYRGYGLSEIAKTHQITTRQILNIVRKNNGTL